MHSFLRKGVILKYLEQFVIPFSGLKEGEHLFDFEIEPAFFDFFEDSEISSGKFKLAFQLIKKQTLIELVFDLRGDVTLDCHRCNDPVVIPIDTVEKVYLKFGDEEYTESDNIVILSPNEYEINISDLIYEFISLKIPMKIVHNENQCNEEVIRRLEEYSFNEEKEDEIDPRWNDLKGLK